MKKLSTLLLPALVLGVSSGTMAKDTAVDASSATQVHSSKEIKVVAVELDGVIRQWDAAAVFKSIGTALKAEGWLQNMTRAQARTLMSIIWTHLKGGKGFGPEELYVALANNSDNPALANLIINIVNSQTLNQAVVQRLRSLKQMGYQLIICSKLGQSSFEKLRDDEEAYPNYKFLNTIFGGKETVTRCSGETASTEGVLNSESFEAFLSRNKLQPHQVLAIVESESAVKAAESTGVKAIRYTSNEDQFNAALAKALGRERQMGVITA